MTTNIGHRAATALLTIRGTYGSYVGTDGSAWCAFRKSHTEGMALGIRPVTPNDDNRLPGFEPLTRIVADGPAGATSLGIASSIEEAVAMIEDRLPLLVAEAMAKNILAAMRGTMVGGMLADVKLDGFPVKNLPGKAGGGRIRQGLAWHLTFSRHGHCQEVVLTTSVTGKNATVSSLHTPWDADLQGAWDVPGVPPRGGMVRVDGIRAAVHAVENAMACECAAGDLAKAIGKGDEDADHYPHLHAMAA